METKDIAPRQAALGFAAATAALHASLERRGWSEGDLYYACSVVNSVDTLDAELAAPLSMTADTELLYPSPDLASSDGPGNPRYQMARHVERQLASLIPCSELFVCTDGCVLVVRERDLPLAELRRRVDRRPFDENDPIELLVGVSSLHAGFRDLPVAREQAERALRWTKEDLGGMLGTARACFYDDAFGQDLGERLGVEKDARWLVPESVARLEAYDRMENGGYRDTLLAYLENGCNVNRTAKALFVHRNTLAYRIKRIRDISGIDLENLREEDDLLRIWLACRVLRDLSRGR